MKKALLGLVLALSMFSTFMAVPLAQADTTNYTVGNTEIISFHLSGQYTATTANAVRFQLPFPAKLVGVTASARASGGTSPTLTVDVRRGGTSVLSAPVAITAGAVAEANIVSGNLADESVITVDLAIGGTTPTWNDITLLLTVVRR